MIIVGKKNMLAVTLTVIIALFLGCNAKNTIDDKATISNRITEIIFSESKDSWNCTIRGNHRLIYTALNQVSPTGILFHFPDTKLNLVNAVQIPPHSQIISSIEANEIVVDRTTTTRMLIGLKVERPYSLSSDEAALKVSFPKIVVLQNVIDMQKELPEKEKETEFDKYIVPVANQLNKVTATSFKNNIIVNLEADGIIKDYNSFAIENPARIVFDVYNLNSPYNTEQIITVESEWVKQIRYFTYLNKIRLVLDTYNRFLTRYSSYPVDTGLIIYIGQNPKTSNKAN